MNVEPTNTDGLDRDTFIEERRRELLSLGESWDSDSAYKLAEQEWETEMHVLSKTAADPDGKPYTHCPDLAERAKRQQECLRQIKELDEVPAHQRWHSLKLLTDQQALHLYIVCVNSYGSDSPVGQDLMRRVSMWLERQRPPRVRKWLQIANEEHIINQPVP